MAKLSIVIPVLGDSRQLDDTLLSVLENRPVDCEIFVVHNRPYHDPYNLSDEVRFIEAEPGAGMVDCFIRALAASGAPVVHLLACGMEVHSGWADAALRHFDAPDVAAVGAVLLDRADERKTVSAGWGYRLEGTFWQLRRQATSDDAAASERDFCGPDARAAFYRRAAIQSVGGFSSCTGNALAGLDWALALRHAGFRCVSEPECRVRCDAAATCDEPAFRRGRHAERLFWRWASSHGWPSSLAGHVALLAGQCVVGLWRPLTFILLAGRVLGAIDALFGRCRSKPTAVVERPSVIAAPHFSAASPRKKRRPSRVA